MIDQRKTVEYGFPVGTSDKNFPANAGATRDADSIPELGRSPGEGHNSLHQYSCLVNPMDRGAWRATDHRDAFSDTTEAT